MDWSKWLSLYIKIHSLPNFEVIILSKLTQLTEIRATDRPDSCFIVGNSMDIDVFSDDEYSQGI